MVVLVRTIVGVTGYQLTAVVRRGTHDLPDRSVHEGVRQVGVVRVDQVRCFQLPGNLVMASSVTYDTRVLPVRTRTQYCWAIDGATQHCDTTEDCKQLYKHTGRAQAQQQKGGNTQLCGDTNANWQDTQPHLQQRLGVVVAVHGELNQPALVVYTVAGDDVEEGQCHGQRVLRPVVDVRHTDATQTTQRHLVRVWDDGQIINTVARLAVASLFEARYRAAGAILSAICMSCIVFAMGVQLLLLLLLVNDTHETAEVVVL